MVILSGSTWRVVYHNRLIVEQQKAGTAGLDIAGVFRAVSAGVFGTVSGDIPDRVGS
jgi:hypothetical protein